MDTLKRKTPYFMVYTFCTVTFMAQHTFANDKHIITIPSIEENIVVDAEMNENAWKKAAKMDFLYENKPGNGVLTDIKTEIFFYESKTALNVAIKAYDADPSKIRASLRDRDAIWQDDNVGFIIDTFNDEREAYEFYVNPLGAQADIRMEDSNGWNEDSTWDAIWYSAGQITDYGYIVEISIPFNSLRFPNSDEKLEWSFAGWRNIPRDTLIQTATFSRNLNIKCNLCQMDKIKGFEDVTTSNNLQLTPTLTFSRQDTKDALSGNWNEGDTDVQAGMDLRFGVTQNMVLNATINPDFSQVEADTNQLGVNTTFALFYDEKRPFFLDGASYFDTERLNLVHTRNVAEPDYGLKLTGKSGDHSYGLLMANDQNTQFLLPGSQSSKMGLLKQKSKLAIARYKLDVGELNDVGFLATKRSSKDYHNDLISLNGGYNVNHTDKISYNLAYSSTKNADQIIKQHDISRAQKDHAISIGFDRKTRDYNLFANYDNLGKDFRADLGFINQTNYERFELGGRQRWYGEEDDFFTQYGYFGNWDKSVDQSGQLLQEEFEIHANLQGNMQLFTNFGLLQRETYYDGQYFDQTQFQLFAEFNPLSNLQFSLRLAVGDEIDYVNTQLGRVTTFEPGLSWDVNQHLKLDVNLQYSQLNVDKNEESAINSGRLYKAQQAFVRAKYQFDMRNSLKVVLQYTDIKHNTALYSVADAPDRTYKDFSTQLIYAYKVNPQTLFFLGYSDNGYQDDSVNKLERSERTFFSKFSYAWQM